ncbi:MAG: metallophosphoesterase, partial [Peptococcaceae bacterium]|nr:metallophosphoesterase [Peptococcaceae bacterium]
PLMLYLFLTLIVIDLFRFLNRWLHIIPDSSTYSPVAVGIAVLIFVVGLIAYGVWNAHNTRISHYEVDIHKDAAGINEMRVVLVSDIHIGSIIDKERVGRMVERVNSLNPDLIVMPGDLFDGDLSVYLEQNIYEEISSLQATYGIFAVFGNHDYMGGISSEAQRLLLEAGVVVLRDEYRLVADSFYVVGREDWSLSMQGMRSRLDLADIMADVDRAKPVLLLDHQPFNLAEGREQGVDLQLSGHTHRGQLFPFSIVTNMLFEQDWGYLNKDGTQLVVSCGYGTWGPPLRLNSVSEIVLVTVRFAK